MRSSGFEIALVAISAGLRLPGTCMTGWTVVSSASSVKLVEASETHDAKYGARTPSDFSNALMVHSESTAVVTW